jgi:hypothetical protein
MKKFLKPFTLLVIMFLSFGAVTTSAYAASPSNQYFLEFSLINGVIAQAKAENIASTVVRLDLKSVNLPDGTVLTVVLNQAVQGRLIAPVVIGTVTIVKGQAKAEIDFSGKLTGRLDSLYLFEKEGFPLIFFNAPVLPV